MELSNSSRIKLVAYSARTKSALFSRWPEQDLLLLWEGLFSCSPERDRGDFSVLAEFVAVLSMDFLTASQSSALLAYHIGLGGQLHLNRFAVVTLILCMCV